MTELSNNQLRRLDMSLLLIFLSLLRTQKAAETADEIGITPSGVSQALKRLRDIFGDPLFLRQPHGLEPTALARGLEQPVRGAVDLLRGALDQHRVFDPAKAEGVIRIAANDTEFAEIIPTLFSKLALEAPNLRLEFHDCGDADALDRLAGATLDIAIGRFADVPSRIEISPMYSTKVMIVGQKTCLEQITAPYDSSLQKMRIVGVTGNQTPSPEWAQTSVTVPTYSAALSVLQRMESIAFLPCRIATQLAPHFGLSAIGSPFPIPRADFALAWHKRNTADPRHFWLRSLIPTKVEGFPS